MLEEIGAPFIAFVRPDTSDLAVWNQVVHQRQYAPVVRILEEAGCLDVETILDLGANIGLTAAYLGAIYPNARILAVEPDAGELPTAEAKHRDARTPVCTRCRRHSGSATSH